MFIAGKSVLAIGLGSKARVVKHQQLCAASHFPAVLLIDREERLLH